MAEMQTVGRRMPRFDAEEKVRGQAMFAADAHLPGELVAKFLPSAHAHAEILSVDTSRAEALPGVRAVITAADIPGIDTYDPNSRFHAFLARRYAVFAGQPVAAVAADDLATAEEALDLIEVAYRPLPVIHDIDEALKPGAALVAHSEQKLTWSTGAGHSQTAAIQHDDEPEASNGDEHSNAIEKIAFRYGDLLAAFADSDVVIENTYTVPVVHQGYIEPHAVMAYWDRPNHITVWECVQGAFAARDLIARTLGIPQTAITLNATEIGGGFGGKVEGLFAPLVVLLAKKAGRPVKLVLTRAEEFWAADPAPATRIRAKSGAKKDGTLTGLEVEVLLDAGAFPTGWIMTSVTLGLRNVYNFKAWYLRGMEVLTNKASVAAYRAPGGPNASFAIESQMDDMARALGIDPLEFRRGNLTLEGDLLANREPQVKIGAVEVLDALVDHGAWPPTSLAERDENGWLIGRGMAIGGWDGANGPASALVILEADGNIRVTLGTVDLTGSYTSMAQIAAEALGVSVGRIVMSKASPDYAPFAPMSAGSQTIYAMGAAVFQAAQDLRDKILEHVAQYRSLPTDQFAINDVGVYQIDDPKSVVGFPMLFQLGSEWFATGGPLIGVGSADKRQRAPGYAASVAEVAIDPDTGFVRLRRLVTAQDAGKAINPLLVEGQIQGGSVQSAGFALWEDLMFDQNAHVRNPGLLDYRIATAADVPRIEALIVEAPGGDGPYGAKIVGEPSIIPPVAAIANAVTAAIGVRITDLPLTPERIWRAMQLHRSTQPDSVQRTAQTS